MQTTNYIPDGTKTIYDAERLIFHHLKNKAVNYLQKKRRYFALQMVSIVFAASFFLLLITTRWDAGYCIALMSLFLSLFILFLILSIKLKPQIKLKKISLIYLPISKVPFNNGSLLIDRSGLTENVNFTYPGLSAANISLAQKIYRQIVNQTENFPAVLPPETKKTISRKGDIFQKKGIHVYSREAELVNSIDQLANTYKKVSRFEARLPIFSAENKIGAYLVREWVAPGGKEIVFEKTDRVSVKNEIAKITGLVAPKNNNAPVASHDIDIITQNASRLLLKILPRFNYTLKRSLTDIITQFITQYLQNISYTSFNYYCPECNKEQINFLQNPNYAHEGDGDKRVNFNKNTRMRLINLKAGIWQCPLCDHQSSAPFPVHKMTDELFNEVYDKLYEENYKDRLNIYNHISDEKRRNKNETEVEMHKIQREHRHEVDGIKSRIRGVRAEVEADEAAINSLSTIMLKYERLTQERAANYKRDIDRIKTDINEKAEEAKQQVHSIVNNAKNNISEELSKNAQLERQDQAKRDQLQQETAAYMKQTAENTGRIADVQMEIAENTGHIADVQMEIAENTGHIADVQMEIAEELGLNEKA